MLWYIAVGSAFGGVSRYLLGGAIQRIGGTTFPAGTLVVNLTGSFLLGAIIRFAVDTPAISPEWRAFLTIGFCGGKPMAETRAIREKSPACRPQSGLWRQQDGP